MPRAAPPPAPAPPARPGGRRRADALRPAHASRWELEKVLECGIDKTCPKPYTNEVVLEAVQQALLLSRQRRADHRV